MVKIELKDLPSHHELIGQRINVVRQGGKYHYDYQDDPMIRIFCGAKKIRRKDGTWIRWEWARVDHKDCGYSEALLDSEYTAGSYIQVDKEAN